MQKSKAVPCETCLGTGKRRILVDKYQLVLPLSVMIKAGQVFQKYHVEESFEGDGFVFCVEMKGTYAEMIKKEDDFHRWLRENYPKEISMGIALTVDKIKEVKDGNEQ